MANKLKSFNILNHQGGQIKATLRCYLTPVRMAAVKKTTNAGEDMREKDPYRL
jgi:hypothetical protein